ncbi:MAG: hypothetical protein OSB41_07380 [Kiritimatiellae bacterium]|nr:hypothetical protein [Kiritimatiellia bacterium]
MLKDEKTLIVTAGSLLMLLIILIGALVNRGCRKHEAAEEALAPVVPPVVVIAEDPKHPARPIPPRFKRDTHMPNGGEGDTSGSINLGSFSAGRDLVFIDDDRVWWESDNDKDDDECDHSMHFSMETPFRRLIQLVTDRGGKLKVQDSFRVTGVHSSNSLHKEGRGLDVTCDELGLEMLARLCWAAGFDWVYYEASSRGGAHVHCSVKR